MTKKKSTSAVATTTTAAAVTSTQESSSKTASLKKTKKPGRSPVLANIKIDDEWNDVIFDDPALAKTTDSKSAPQPSQLKHNGGGGSSINNNSSIIKKTKQSATPLNGGGGGGDDHASLPDGRSVNSTRKVLDSYTMAATHFDLSKALNFKRTHLNNVIKKSHKEHRKASHKHKEDIKRNMFIVSQCQTILGRVQKIKKRSKTILLSKSHLLPKKDDLDASIASLSNKLISTSGGNYDNESFTSGKHDITLRLLDDMSDELFETLECVGSLEQKLMTQNDEIAKLNDKLHELETGVKKELAQFTKRSAFVMRDVHSAANAIDQNPIVIYKQTELQNKIFS